MDCFSQFVLMLAKFISGFVSFFSWNPLMSPSGVVSPAGHNNKVKVGDTEVQ